MIDNDYNSLIHCFAAPIQSHTKTIESQRQWAFRLKKKKRLRIV